MADIYASQYLDEYNEDQRDPANLHKMVSNMRLVLDSSKLDKDTLWTLSWLAKEDFGRLGWVGEMTCMAEVNENSYRNSTITLEKLKENVQECINTADQKITQL